MSSRYSNTIVMVEGALCVAFSYVLSYFDLFRMPQGGTVDFELVPLIIFAYRRGIKWGLGTGALFGIIRAFLGGYILNPVQFILDYPLAFACVGLIAIHPKIIGFIISAAGQISCSIVSGAIFFSQYAPEGQNPWVYSFWYNMPTLGMKYVLSWIVALILWKALERELPVRDKKAKNISDSPVEREIQKSEI